MDFAADELQRASSSLCSLAGGGQPPDAPWRAGLALAAIYVGSLLTGSLVAGLIGRFLPRERGVSMLAMELPLYRRPQLKPILKMTWARSSDYLKKRGPDRHRRRLPLAAFDSRLRRKTDYAGRRSSPR